MFSARRLKFLSLALLMSGGTVVLTQQWMHEAVRKASAEAVAKAGPAAPAPTTQVLVAATALPAGAIVRPGQVRWQAWPAGAPTTGYLTQANAHLEQMNGAIVRANLDAGEPLTASRIVQPGDRGFLAAVLRPGYRAITVNVTAASGVAGFVMPGDHVDLLVNVTAGGNAGSTDRRIFSETILQDVRVLAMDQRAAEKPAPDAKTGDPKKDVAIPQTATLEVTPKGAEIIGVATQLGPLSLSLRSLAEPQTPAPLERQISHTNIGEALGVEPHKPATPRPRPAAAAAVRPAEAGVQLYRGSQATMIRAGGAQ